MKRRKWQIELFPAKFSFKEGQRYVSASAMTCRVNRETRIIECNDAVADVDSVEAAPYTKKARRKRIRL